MSNDCLRTSMVTKLVCAQCGDYLTMSYERPPTPRAIDSNHHLTDENITGAAKFVVNIPVHPCGKCYRKALEPLEALRKLLKHD